MTVQGEKAYYLKNLELAVLLSVKGMNEFYGIKMENLRGLDKSLVYRTLFELEKNRIVSLEEGRFVVRPELDLMLEDIRDAVTMLSYASAASEYPDQCIYLGRQAVIVSAYGTAGEVSRLESVETSRLPERIYEFGFCLEEEAGSLDSGGEAVDAEPVLVNQADRLFGRDYNTLRKEDWGTATACLRIFSVKDRKCVRQYLLLKGSLKDYISITDRDASSFYVYSREKVIDILTDDFRGGIWNHQEGAEG